MPYPPPRGKAPADLPGALPKIFSRPSGTHVGEREYIHRHGPVPGSQEQDLTAGPAGVTQPPHLLTGVFHRYTPLLALAMANLSHRWTLEIPWISLPAFPPHEGRALSTLWINLRPPGPWRIRQHLPYRERICQYFHSLCEYFLLIIHCARAHPMSVVIMPNPRRHQWLLTCPLAQRCAPPTVPL